MEALPVVDAHHIRKKDIAVYERNPFIEGVEVPIGRRHTVIGKAMMLVDPETGVVDDVPQITKVSEYDKEKFVKVYTDQLKRFFSLAPTSLKLVIVIMNQMRNMIEEDQLFLNLKTAQKYFSENGHDLKKSTYHRSIKELLVKGFIAQSALGNDLYFLNPALFFNGNRVRFITEFKAKEEMQATLPGMDTTIDVEDD